VIEQYMVKGLKGADLWKAGKMNHSHRVIMSSSSFIVYRLQQSVDSEYYGWTEQKGTKSLTYQWKYICASATVENGAWGILYL